MQMLRIEVVAMLVAMATISGPLGATASPARPLTPAHATATAATPEDAPVLVVLDVSGSMDDTDGAGRLKLQSAKNAVDRALRAGGSSTDTGVWTFPGAERCSAGSQLSAPGAGGDTGEAIAKVDALQTQSGGTPIGTALQAATASLKSEGYSGATILLVTDGINNCDPDPCTVATDIVQSGFHLKVDGIGFAAEKGTEVALSCIADATGGTTASADDGQALDDIFDSLTMPTIEVTTSAPDTVTAGQTFSLGVSVHNPSVHDVQDVSASLAFVRDPQHTIRPTASPATLQVGTVPAGRSVSRVWTVSSDSSWEGLQASWRVAVTGTNVRGVQRTGSIRFSKAVLPLTGALLSPALDHNWPIVIMGDSFSAGEGGGDYKPATRSALLRCHRSYKTYLADVLKPSQVRILACSGAVIADLYDDQVTDDGEFRATAQLDQLLALDAPPGAVVLTLGGNDAGFADIIKACVGHALLGLSDKDCRDDNSVGEQNLDDIGYRWHDLRRVYEDLWKAANNPRFVAQRGGKYVPVIVSTYPQEFPPAWLGYCKAHSAFTQPAIRYANELAAALMASSNHGAQAARNDGYEVYSTGDPIGAFLPSHTYCADVLRTWVQPLANPDPHRWNGKDPLGYLTSTVAGQQAMHPNANGYLAITDILRTWEAAQTRVEATDAVKRLVAEPASSASVSSVLGSALPAPTAGVSVVAGGSATLQQGQSATIDATGFAPNTPVLLTLHSVPVGLGTTLADSKGVVRLRSMIPTDTEPGRHRLMATGVDSSGADREVAIDLTVVRPIPVWVGLVGALAALALLIAAGLVIGSRPRRRRPHPLPAP